MPLQRRSVLALVGATVTATAGCLGGDGRTDSSTAEQTASATPPPSCQRQTILPEAESGRVYPDFPTTLSEDSVADFVADFELAYHSNRLRRQYNSLSVTDRSATVTDSRSVDGGWLVAVHVELGYSYGSSGESLSPVHGDLSERTSYFVGTGRVVRAEHATSGILDPRDELGGAIVRCR